MSCCRDYLHSCGLVDNTIISQHYIIYINGCSRDVYVFELTHKQDDIIALVKFFFFEGGGEWFGLLCNICMLYAIYMYIEKENGFVSEVTIMGNDVCRVTSQTN